MSFVAELKRRNVFRIGIAYTLLGWVLLQGADFALDLVDAPNWVIQVFVIAVIIGLPIALFFAWAFEITPEGIKREHEVDRSQSIASKTGGKLDRAIIVFLALAVMLLLGERFLWPQTDSKPLVQESITSAASLSEQKSIAVLPFVNMSSDPEQEYFSDGVAEEILNVLADVPDLKVAARTSAFTYKGSDLKISEIARELGVTHVLEGSVRKAGNQVRVTAQLIKADDGFHLWSETYDRELTNIFAIQDEIADNIASVLEVHLLGEKKSYTTAQDLSPVAYEKFLKARYLMRRRNEVDMAEAQRLSEEVTTEAPDFPGGLIQLAETLVQGPTRSASTPQIEELTLRALTLDPELAAGHMMLGMIEQDADNPLGAIEYLQKAIELDSSEPRPHHWLGINYANTGYLEKGRAELQTAVDLEPDHANANGYLGYVLLLLGDYNGAARHFTEQVRLGNEFGSPRLVHVEVLKGNLEQARAMLRIVDGVLPEETTRVERFLDAYENPELIDEYLNSLTAIRAYDWHIMLELYLLGQYEKALDLQFEFDQIPRDAWADIFAEARSLPRFMEIIKIQNLDDVWDELGPPPVCRKEADGYDCSAE